MFVFVLYNTTYIENKGASVKSIMEACQKRGVAAPTWTVNGGFVVVTFKRPTKGDTQDDTQGDTQSDTQDGTQRVPQVSFKVSPKRTNLMIG